MKILFIGNYADDVIYDLITKKEICDLSQAGRLFQRRLIEGLIKQTDDFKAVSILPTDRKTNLPKIIQDMKIDIEVVPVVKGSIGSMARAMREIRDLLKNECGKETKVLMYAVNPIALIPLRRLKKNYGLTLITICSELPRFRRYKKTIKNKIKRKVFDYFNHKFDKYIIFADAMREYLPQGRPCMLLEGFAPDNIQQPHVREKNIAMYAGGLAEDNGIRMMIEAAHKSKHIDELWICGVGTCQAYIEQNTDSKVKYLGRLSNTEVLEHEKQAKALLNIRDPRNDLTKFSFPSKVLEYMATGGIVVSSELPGIPKEYYQYIKLLKEYTASEVATHLDEIFSMSDTEFLNKTGATAEFVKSKTAEQRVGSILKFIVGDALYEN